MFEVSIISALVGGLLTFLAPCTLPIIPAYIAYIGGENKSENTPRSRWSVLLNAVFFTFGFSFIFVLFGLVSGSLGTYFVLHRTIISQLGGVVIILFGLSLLGVISLPQLSMSFMRGLPSFVQAGNKFGALLLGIVFALGWSPCVGPVLGTILVLASTSGSATYGAFLLLIYSLGLAVPFILVAYVYGTTFTYVIRLQKYLPLISRIGGVMLILIGGLLVFRQFGMLNTWMIQIFGEIGYERLVEMM